MSTITRQDPDLERNDQEQFDARVARTTPLVLEVLAGIGILSALLLSVIALLIASGKSDTSTVNVPAGMMNGVVAGQSSTPATAAVPATPAPTLSLTVAGGNKKGPDGKMHDSFSKTEFAVKVGQPTRLRIDNKDDAPHTITSAGAGVSIVVKPGVHMYNMVATSAGRFEWHCILPCDGGPNGWAMSHSGYMAGHITAS